MVVKTYFVYSDDDDRRRGGGSGSGCDGSWYPSQARNNSLGLYIDTLHSSPSSSSSSFEKRVSLKDDGIYVKDRTEDFVVVVVDYYYYFFPCMKRKKIL